MTDSVHRYTRFGILLLLILYCINGVIYLNRQSITFDEPGHFHFGVQVLKGSTARAGDPGVTNSKMPVSALNALPRAVEQLVHPGLKKTDYGSSDILHGRYVTLAVSLLIGIYVFKWSRDLYGEQAGIFSLFLFVFCPNCLAHAPLVTTDSYAALALLVVLFYLWRYLSLGRNRDFWLFCILTAVAQLVKQSLLHLYLIIPCLLLFRYLWGGDRRPLNGRSLMAKTGLFLLVNILVINAGFFFQGFGTPLSGYHFQSTLFRGLQMRLAFAGSFPLPLPISFVQGLDMARYYLQLGGGFPQSSFGKVSILGYSSTGGSFWYYYFVTCFYKTPIALLCLITWSLFRLMRRASFAGIVRNELFLLFPVGYFLILMDFFYTSQTNIRQIIFIYPPLYILCGILLRDLRAKWEKGVLALLLLVYLGSVLSFFGNYIPYTNEFIPDKKMAYRIVGMNNLEFGQSELFLQDYLRAHPGVFMADTILRPGRQVIRLFDFMDAWNKHQYDWLRPYEPVDDIANDYLIFDIPNSKIKK